MDTINKFLKKFHLDDELYDYIYNLDVMCLPISFLDNCFIDNKIQFIKDINFSLFKKKEIKIIKQSIKTYLKLLIKLKKRNDFIAYKEFIKQDNIIIKPFIIDKNYKGCHYLIKMNDDNIYIELYDDEDNEVVFSLYFEEKYFKLIFRNMIFIKDHEKVFYKNKEYIDNDNNFIEINYFKINQVFNQLLDLGDDNISKLILVGNPFKTLNTICLENIKYDFKITIEFNEIKIIIKFNIFTDNFFIIQNDAILRIKNYKLKYKNLINE